MPFDERHDNDDDDDRIVNRKIIQITYQQYWLIRWMPISGRNLHDIANINLCVLIKCR